MEQREAAGSLMKAYVLCFHGHGLILIKLFSISDFRCNSIALCYRFSCILPAAVAPPPQLYAANPPPSYSLAQKSFRRQLQEASAPHNAEIRSLACPAVVSFSDVHMLEMDSGVSGGS